MMDGSNEVRGKLGDQPLEVKRLIADVRDQGQAFDVIGLRLGWIEAKAPADRGPRMMGSQQDFEGPERIAQGTSGGRRMARRTAGRLLGVGRRRMIVGGAPEGAVDDADDPKRFPMGLKGVEEAMIARGGGEEGARVEVEEQLGRKMGRGWIAAGRGRGR